MQSEVADLGGMNAPNTDQLNADDLIAGPRIFTIVKITKGKGSGSGKGDQPINIHLAEHPHPWRPCKTVRRLLMDAWGSRPGDWPDGAQVELYRDTEVRFGGDTVGGIRVRAMSHLKSAKIEHLSTATRGQRVKWEIRRLDRTGQTVATTNDVQANLDRAVRLFGEINVTLADLEMQLGSGRAKWGAAELKQLREDYGARRKAEQRVAEEASQDTAHDGELTDEDRLRVAIEEIEADRGVQPDERARFRGENGLAVAFGRATMEQLRAYKARLVGGAK